MIPTHFHLSEVRVGEEFIIGASIPGTIYFASARTEHMAWGVTSNNLDKSDIFEEKINNSGDKYLFEGKWKDLHQRHELIEVKDGETVNHTV